MSGLTRIFLGGKLGQIFGKEWNLHVNSPAEALRAINVNTGGKLKEYLRQNRNTYYKFAINKKHNLLNSEEIKRPTGNRDIFIFPSIKGRNNVLRIIAGVVIIIIALVIDYVTFGAYSLYTQYLYQLGIGLIIGGVVGLLIGDQGFPEQRFSEATGGSNLFANGAMVVGQGLPVRLIYGRALINVADTPISIAYSNFDQSPNYGGGNTTYSNSDDFPGGTFLGYSPGYDSGTGLTYYNQTRIPIIAGPVGY